MLLIFYLFLEMLLKKYIIILLFLFCFRLHAEDITVAVAANLQFVFQEISTNFKNKTGIEVKTILGASGKLTAQILNGAPFDIFMSADNDYPQSLYKTGFTYGEPKIYTYGSLVFWTFKDVKLEEINRLLLSSDIKTIAVANPKTAPYGREAVNYLKNSKIYEKIKDKLIYGESISQVNQYISSGSSDIGITAKSIVVSPEMKNKGKWVAIDEKSYNPIAQSVVILKYGNDKNPKSSKLFFDYLFSDEVKHLFLKYGYKIN